MNAETSPATPEWQPIETAPKDGTWYLASDGVDRWTQNEPPMHFAGEWRWDEDREQWRGSANGAEAIYWKPLDPLPGAAAPTPLQAEMQKSDQFHLTRNDGSRATASEAVDALHGQIMNLPCVAPSGSFEYSYKNGHRDARNAAAELVAAFASSGSSEKDSESESAAPLPVQGQDDQAKNAARYEWLRERGVAYCGDPERHLERGLVLRFTNLDSRIDAALRASSAPE